MTSEPTYHSHPRTNVTSKLRQQMRSNPKNRGSIRQRRPISIKPRRRRKESKVIYYLHIHKAGGSTMCKQALKQKLSVSFKNGCNVQEDQHCCGMEDSLEAQIRYANDTGFDFVAAEKEMYDTMATDYYDYVVTLRDSATRYVSHWKHVMNIQDARQKQGKKILVRNFSAWWELQPDNYSTRMICGFKCLDRSKFQITPQLFQYTLQRLSLFSHVLFLENMEASYTTFATAIGWNTGLKVAHENKAESNNKNKNKDKNDTKTMPEKINDPFMTALDDALYAFARKRYEGNYTNHSDTLLLVKQYANSTDVQDYFRDGRDRNCIDPCCGTCSKWR